jgi:IS30 family transposase
MTAGGARNPTVHHKRILELANQGLSVKVIAERMGMKHDRIKRLLERNGIKALKDTLFSSIYYQLQGGRKR